MYVLEWRTASALTRGFFWCLFPELQNNEENNTKKHSSERRNSLSRQYIPYFFFTWHNESINEDKSYDLYISSPCLTRSVFVLLVTSQSIADDVAMTSQWPDNCD